MRFDPTFDTILTVVSETHYLVPASDAVAVEAAYRDGDPVLSFQSQDPEGEVSTVNLKTERCTFVRRSPFTPEEMAKRQQEAEEGKKS